MSNNKDLRGNELFAVTGQVHGAIVEAISEDHARKIFEAYYRGEWILSVKDLKHSRINNL